MVRRKFDLAVMAACLALLGYFGWYAFSGPRGFKHMKELSAQASALDADLRKIADQRDQLDKRVGLMRPDSIDPDMADELARRMLDFAKPNELVVMNPPAISMR